MSRSALRPATHARYLEIHTNVASKAAGPSGGRDPAERSAVDVGVWRAPVWMVQHVDGIHSEFDALRFRYPDSFTEIHVQTQGRRSPQVALREIGKLPRTWIHNKEVARNVCDSQPAVRRLRGVQRGDVGPVRIGNLAKALKISHDTGC